MYKFYILHYTVHSKGTKFIFQVYTDKVYYRNCTVYTVQCPNCTLYSTIYADVWSFLPKNDKILNNASGSVSQYSNL